MQQSHAGGRSETRSDRLTLGWTWWMTLVVVTVVLGLLGRGDSGFLSVFLWSVVGFVVGSVVVVAVGARMTPARAEAFSDRTSTGGAGVPR